MSILTKLEGSFISELLILVMLVVETEQTDQRSPFTQTASRFNPSNVCLIYLCISSQLFMT